MKNLKVPICLILLLFVHIGLWHLSDYLIGDLVSDSTSRSTLAFVLATITIIPLATIVGDMEWP